MISGRAKSGFLAVWERERNTTFREITLLTSHRTRTYVVRGRISCCRTSSIVVWACFGGIFFTVYAVYAVYAISSLDTGSPLRHRTQNMQRRRDTSCRARSPALHVGRTDRVARPCAKTARQWCKAIVVCRVSETASQVKSSQDGAMSKSEHRNSPRGRAQYTSTHTIHTWCRSTPFASSPRTSRPTGCM